MRRLMLYACAGLLTASTATAGPITLGTWLSVPPPSEAGDAPWSNPSWDGYHQNLGYILDLSGMEYLHAPFTFDDAIWGEPQMIATALPHGFFTFLPGGVITFNNTIGDVFTSNGLGWENFWMLRNPGGLSGLLGAEDLPQGFNADGSPRTDNDTDWYVRWTRQTDAPPVCRVDCEPPPEQIPEPVSLTLFGLAAYAVARRLRRAA